MWPTLLSLGPLKITTAGVIFSLTFFFVSFWIWKRGREEHFEEEALMDLVILGTLVGLVASRIFFVLLNSALFSSFWQVFQLANIPGFSWYGALIGGLVVFILFTRQKKWQTFLLADLISPGLVLALALGKLADFFNGAFYGRETKLPWGLVFPGFEKPRHPTQLYSFILYLILLWLILKIEKEYRFYRWYQGKKRETAPGFVFFSFLLGTGLAQFGVAFFLSDWLYWKGIPLIFLFPGLEILAGGLGIIIRSGLSFKEKLNFWQKIKEFLKSLKKSDTKEKIKIKINQKPKFFKAKTRIKVGREV